MNSFTPSQFVLRSLYPTPCLKYSERTVHACCLFCLFSHPLNTVVRLISILIRAFLVSKYSSLILLYLPTALRDVDGHILWVLFIWLQWPGILLVFLLPLEMSFFYLLLFYHHNVSTPKASTTNLLSVHPHLGSFMDSILTSVDSISNGCL